MIVLLPLLVVGAVLALRARGARLAPDPALVGGGAAVWVPSRVRVLPDRVRALASLTWAEGRRIVLHPAIPAGLLLGLLVTGLSRESDPFGRYELLTGGLPMGLFFPPAVFIAASLCATRTRRSRAGELFDATPTADYDRTLAQCLAALGPMLVAVAYEAVSFGYFRLRGLSLPATPSVWEFLALPLSVLGAGTLGVMVGRWLPFRGAPLAVLVGLVYGSAAVGHGFPMLITLVTFPKSVSENVYTLVPHPVISHALWLLALDVMAVIGALLVHRAHRWTLLGLGAVAIGCAAWAATFAT